MTVGPQDFATGQSDIQHLDPFRRVQTQIGRLDVSMDEAHRVNVLKPKGRLAQVLAGLSRVKRSLVGDQSTEVRAGYEFLGKPIPAAVPTGVVGVGDVRMVESTKRPDFSSEPGDQDRVGLPIGTNHLGSCQPAHSDMAGQKYVSHPTRAKSVQEDVRAENQVCCSTPGGPPSLK
jgi:hypothetical protein